jgi:hypothetical protein
MLAPDKNMALALTRRAMTDVPWSGGMSHTKTRPGEAGAALSSMKGGIDPVPGTDGILPSDRSSAIFWPCPGDREGLDLILRRSDADGYRRILKISVELPSSTTKAGFRPGCGGRGVRGGARRADRPDGLAATASSAGERSLHGWQGCVDRRSRRSRNRVYRVLFASLFSCRTYPPRN